tara:strand:- start:184 stop:564 length:381 start_codon:yes stop_codon:yes gene_type:complete
MSNKEIDRVLSNPDNLIVSDSLRGRIDLGLEEQPEVSAILSFGKESLSGKFIKHSKTYFAGESGEEKIQTSTFVISFQAEFIEKLIGLELETNCSIEVFGNSFSGKIFTLELYSKNGEVEASLVIE